jgi:hypothetical protein
MPDVSEQLYRYPVTLCQRFRLLLLRSFFVFHGSDSQLLAGAMVRDHVYAQEVGKKCIHSLVWKCEGNPRKRLEVYGQIILKLILWNMRTCKCIQMIRDGSQCQTVLNTIMNCWILWNVGEFLISRTTIKFSRLLHVCRIWGSHSRGYLLRYNGV